MSDKRVESMQIDLDELISLRHQLAECQAQTKQAKREALLEAANLVDNMVRLRFHIRDIAGDVRRMAEGQP